MRLVRLVDDRTAARDWAGLRAARDRCRAAVATGRQLWPVATLAEYRLALVAPPEWAAPMIDDDAGTVHDRPAHRGDRPTPHVGRVAAAASGDSPGAAVVAHERVLRGEALEASSVGGLPNVFDLPYQLAPGSRPIRSPRTATTASTPRRPIQPTLRLEHRTAVGQP